jgi:DNA-binding NtrC family response regulator
MSSDGPISRLPASVASHSTRSLKRCGDPLAAGSSGARDVVVHTLDEEYFKRIDDALAASGFAVRRVRDPDAAAQIRRRSRAAIALVAVTAEPVTNAPVLRSIHALKQTGYTVFCYGEQASTWTLGAQSRLLIAGASHVLDSAHQAFAADLRQRLNDFATAEADREQDDRRIAQQMRALGIIGHSAAIMNVVRWIVRVSPVSSLPVLLAGETGTGKELAARAIHALDPRRRQQPFIPVNCGAMNAALAESELFGHRRGAFTGADRDRRGLIRAAHGGVLFLDEIGDLELGLQATLLRVLQERQVLALGEDHEVPVDVRIIAATNRDIEEMVRTSRFRADLFHRLSALSMRMPSLRDRADDIQPLVDHFIARHVETGRAGPIAAGAEFVAALRSVALPGNVRQLENVVHCALVCSGRGNELRLRDLPPEIWQELAHAESGQSPALSGAAAVEAQPGKVDAVGVLEAASWKLGRALDLCEEQIVAAALGASRGNRSRAARLLGISPRTIFNKMRRHRLIA